MKASWELGVQTRRQSLQRGGSRVGGFPDFNGLPWENTQGAGLLTASLQQLGVRSYLLSPSPSSPA
ncbi:hypothetical protein [Nostoc sp. CCY 9925]|uniref:hypothetical protein n=1 Tax=Nostoc sp. CCY 9925 TaxID=3103865 RepID=UPI0039C6ABB0